MFPKQPGGTIRFTGGRYALGDQPNQRRSSTVRQWGILRTELREIREALRQLALNGGPRRGALHASQELEAHYSRTEDQRLRI